MASKMRSRHELDAKAYHKTLLLVPTLTSPPVPTPAPDLYPKETDDGTNALSDLRGMAARHSWIEVPSQVGSSGCFRSAREGGRSSGRGCVTQAIPRRCLRGGYSPPLHPFCRCSSSTARKGGGGMTPPTLKPQSPRHSPQPCFHFRPPLCSPAACAHPVTAVLAAAHAERHNATTPPRLRQIYPTPRPKNWRSKRCALTEIHTCPQRRVLYAPPGDTAPLGEP